MLGQRHKSGTVACDARSFAMLHPPLRPNVFSPNRKSEVHITRRFGFDIITAGKAIAMLKFQDMSCCIEIGWSPNSGQFFIMYSDGGAMGGFHVRLYRIIGDKLIKSPAVHGVAKEFESRHDSHTPGINIYFLDWTPDSRGVFIIAEVPDVSDYGSRMGLFRGFFVNALTGKVLRRFGESTTLAIEKSCRVKGILSLPAAAGD